MDTTTTAPPTFEAVCDEYNRIAPGVSPDAGDTAAQLTRILTLTGLRHAVLARAGGRDGDDAETAALAMAAVSLLALIRETHAPADVQAIAQGIARRTANPGAVSSWLTDHAPSTGVDAAEVKHLAHVESALLADQVQVAELAARELDARAARSEQAARDLAKAVWFQARTLYAASIDIARGDRDAAVQVILNGQPDQHDGELWNGCETGAAWLRRTEGSPGTPAAACPEPARA